MSVCGHRTPWSRIYADLRDSPLSHRCPLTMAILDHPVTSTVCRHSYSKDAIHNYIEQARSRREQAKCPRSGCAKNISMSVLQEDKDLAKRVLNHKRRLEQQEASKRTQATAIID